MTTTRLVLEPGRFMMLRLADLETDGRFNREPSPGHVRNIVSKPNPRAWGVLVIWRDGERFFILDGQHRVQALRILGVDQTAKNIPSIVHEGLTLDTAAELFVDLNGSRLVSSYDKHKALRVAGHSKACAIEAMVANQGLMIVKAARDRDACIAAVTALYRVYDLGEPEGVVLALTLKTLYDTWKGQSEAYTAPLIRGVGLYYHGHRSVAPEALSKALLNGPGQPINLIGWAKGLAGTRRMSEAEAVALTIEERIMKRRSPRTRAVKKAAG